MVLDTFVILEQGGEPADTRRVLGLALEVACREPQQPESGFGVFRM